MNKAVFSSVISACKRSFLNHFFIILAACSLLITTLVYSSADAQIRGRIPEAKTADQIIADMKDQLNLTDEQEAKIRPIIEEQIKKRGALIEKYQGQGREGMGSLRNEMQELSKSTENQLQSILTKEQMENYRNMQAEERQKMRKGFRGRRSGKLRGQRFFCEL